LDFWLTATLDAFWFGLNMVIDATFRFLQFLNNEMEFSNELFCSVLTKNFRNFYNYICYQKSAFNYNNFVGGKAK